MKPSYGQQEFIETKNNLSLLKEDLDRQQMLAQENAASEKTLMTARTHYENTLARHASLRERSTQAENTLTRKTARWMSTRTLPIPMPSCFQACMSRHAY